MTTTQIQPEAPMTFEQLWAMLQEIGRSQKETELIVKETALQMKETDKRLDRVTANMEESGIRLDRVTANMEESGIRLDRVTANMEETGKLVDKRLDRVTANMEESGIRLDRVTKNVGGLNQSMGELIETLIAAKLWEKFDAYPYNLKRAYQRVPIYDETNRSRTEIDIMLANGDYVMAVEVKASLHRQDDVDYHLRRMELIRQYPPEQCKGKILLGALAGGVVQPEIRDRAHQEGFFVLELAGESVHLVEQPAGFSPRQW